MKQSPYRQKIKDNTNYITGSVHYNKRSYDKQFEIVAVLPNSEIERLGLHIGGEVVLDIASSRQDALDAVRFFRGHSHNNNKDTHA